MKLCYETVVFIVKRDFGIDTEDGDKLIFFTNSVEPYALED
jgi:hypothetical protein